MLEKFCGSKLGGCVIVHADEEFLLKTDHLKWLFLY